MVLILASTAALGAEPPSEKILSFHADVAVRADSTLDVRETIQVRAAGERITRGIFRDFPTRYEAPDGRGIVEVDFEVAEVLRDGAPESWRTETLDNGIRVRIGEADIYLSPGVYTYTVAYRTGRQLGFFADHDELYWNVTGNDWEFPIDLASATVRLPAGIAPESLSLDAYTGPVGAKGKDYQASVGPDGTAGFLAVRPLSPGEGLTIVVAFPKGHVSVPPPPGPVAYLRSRFAGAPIAGAGFLVMLAYFTIVWVRVGRDRREGRLSRCTSRRPGSPPPPRAT